MRRLVLVYLFVCLGPAICSAEEDEAWTLSYGDKVAAMQLARQTLIEHFGLPAPRTISAEKLDRLARLRNRAFVLFRKSGKSRGCWSAGKGDLAQNVKNAIRNTLKDTRYGGALESEEARQVRLKVFVLQEGVEIADRSPGGVKSSMALGVDSLRVVRDGPKRKEATFLNYVPINYGYGSNPGKMLDRLCLKAKLDKTAETGGEGKSEESKDGALAEAVLKDPSVKLYRIPTVHLLESPDPDEVIELYRCDRLIPVTEVNRLAVEHSIRLCGEWFLASMRWNGALEYKWFVNSRAYSSDNNMIRQWMATVALWDLYRFTKDERFRAAASRNLRHNLQAFYREEGERDIGYILYKGKAKLGSAGFALRAILNIDEEGDYSRQLERLVSFILSLQGTDGSFRAIYFPETGKYDRSEKLQRYYVGEALLALMRLYQEKRDPLLLDAVRKAFPFYREFFKKDGHPAAVPWLTQAYYRAYLADDNPEYADFVFRMTDLVASIQNTTGEPQPDMLGRFYDPEHREYGPPLVASTGVYVEGLVDAYRMARIRKDEAREQAYRQAIVLGIRSLMQLQYRDGNLFYVRDLFRTRGGLRGTVLSTSIRMDYTQHAVQAMIRAVEALDSWTLPNKFGFPPTR